MSTQEITYKINGLKRPGFSLFERAILKLNKIPVVRNFSLIRNLCTKIWRVPRSTTFNKEFFISAPLLNIGENVGLADTYIVAYAPINIGKNCSFSFKNMIITSTHDYNNFSTVIGKPVTIGDNVWITSNVTILPGVTIGSNTVIGAGSVVTKDIPSNVFAAGNPCKAIKEISLNK